MKKLLSFATCLALGLTVVGTSAALADAGKFYFDNDKAGWDAVSVWAWTTDDEMWAMDNGFEAWPGIALEKDATTGYYVYDCADVYATNFNVMFNDNGAGQQTNDATAAAAAAGKVCVVSDQDEESKWNGTWEDVAAAPADDAAAADDTTEAPAADDTTEAPAADDTTEAPAADDTASAGKTADATPIVAVAMLGLASMAVVVATRKKIA